MFAVSITPDSQGTGRPPLFSWSDCDPAHQPPNEYIVEGLLRCRGANLLLSAPKVGKSQLVAHLVACFLTRRPVFGRYEINPTFQPRILLLQTEEDRFRVRTRIESNLRGLGYSGAEIEELTESINEKVVVSTRDRTQPVDDMIFSVETHSDWLLTEVREGRYNLVVLDSLRPAHELEENSSTAMRPVTNLVRELAEIGCGLIVHHKGHVYEGGGRKGGDAGRGTSDLNAARDTAIDLASGKFGGAPFVLHVDHRDDAERFVVVRTVVGDDGEVARWEYLGEAEDESEARSFVDREALFSRIDSATTPTELPTRTEAKGMIGNGYAPFLDGLENLGRIVSKTFHNGSPGNNPTYVMRPGQFSDVEWLKAEKRAQGEP